MCEDVGVCGCVRMCVCVGECVCGVHISTITPPPQTML